jgi:membrane-associated phospholipid phosphatase
VSWLTSVDVAVFRFINGTLSNSLFDSIMPIFAGNVWFWPLLIICGTAAIWRGGVRGRICVLMLAIVIPLGDGWITNSIKHAVERPRPCLELEGVNLPMTKSRAIDAADEYRKGCSSSGSFPSGHTTNWFAATMVAAIYFRRTLRFMVPLAFVVGFSRIYNGVHYPSDVLGGAIIGAGYGVAIVFAVDALWRFVGRRFFPAWHERLPSLLAVSGFGFRVSGPENNNAERGTRNAKLFVTPDSHWLRLGYLLIALVFAGRLLFLASDGIELSEDEAYQWLWSKHLALSYFSKPPLIAYVQWLGTHWFGDSEFGVRFFSPVCAAIGSLVMLRFFARHVNARAGFWLVVMVNVTPLLAVGSTLMTVDPLLVLFWTLAMAQGWRAAQPDGRTRDWLLVGLWMGLAFLSKYTALFQWLCWAVFFLVWKPARVQLKKPGVYLALFVNAICALPVIIWNAQHHWVTAAHVATDAKLDEGWKFHPSNMLEFLGGTAGLLHPIFFVAACWAAIALWRKENSKRAALLRYFFAMGAPLFLVYLGYTLHSSVQINWIAASVIPLFCLTAMFWEERERSGGREIRSVLTIAVFLGVFAVAALHESDPFIRTANKILAQFDARPLPSKIDPLRRVRGWSQMARIVSREYQKLSTEGPPAFVIGGHYGTTGLLSFYMPEAKATVSGVPIVYMRYIPRPKSQFYFWPTYRETRRGQNALYVQEKDKPEPPPPDIVKSFASVSEVGSFPIVYRGRVLHQIQIFACRDLR